MSLFRAGRLALTALFVASLAGQAGPFRIVIQRERVVDQLVVGTISVNGEVIGGAYENDSLKITAGEYRGSLRYVSGHNFVGGPFGTIAHRGDFLIEVSGVDGKTDVLLHGGIKPKQSKGCIMLGAVPRSGNVPYLPDDHPLRQLRLLFYGSDVPTSTPDKAISIAILDPLNASSLPDLSGLWTREDGEIVSITHDGAKVVATKVTGNRYVPATEISWEGEYNSRSFSGRGQRGSKSSGPTTWVPVRIVVVDQNRIRVLGFNPDRTYTRSAHTPAPSTGKRQQLSRYDLNGTWIRDDGQRTSIEQTGTAIKAIKLGGGYVPAGEVTWEGDYSAPSFPGRGRLGDGKGKLSWVPVRISIQDQNEIRVTGANFDFTYRRDKSQALGGK